MAPGGRGRGAGGPRPARPARGQRGSLSLEFALTVPALFLVLLVVGHLIVFARDALAVQTAAREGARVAATSSGEDGVRRAVAAALDGRQARVVVTPRDRQVGELVRVTVILESAAGPGGTTVAGSAASVVEPAATR